MAEGSNDQVAPDGGPTVVGGMSRRRFITAIAAVGGTAAAGGVLWKVLADDDDGDGGTAKRATPKLNAAAASTRDLHFRVRPTGLEAPAIIVAGKNFPLVAHDVDSRKDFDALGSGADSSLLTHYATGVAVPAIPSRAVIVDGLMDGTYITPDSRYLGTSFLVQPAALASVLGARQATDQAVSAYAHDPEVRKVVDAASVGAATLSDVQAALASSEAATSGALYGLDEHWDRLGLSAPPTTVEQVALLADVSDDSLESAVGMMLTHPEVRAFFPPDQGVDPTAAAQANGVDLKNLLLTSRAVADFAGTLDDWWASGLSDSLGTFDPILDKAGKPVDFPVPDGDTTKVPASMLSLDPGLRDAYGNALAASVQLVKNAPNLQDRAWKVSTSIPVPVADEGTPLLGSNGVTAAAFGDAVLNQMGGLKLDVGDLVDRELSLTVNNDFMRHVTIGVSFQDNDGKGIKTNFPYADDMLWQVANSTEYLGILGIVSSATNVMGIPLTGLTKSDVTIKLPDRASVANIFLMGMGWGAHPTPAMDYLVDMDGKPVHENTVVFDFQDAGIGNTLTLIMDLLIPSVFLLLDLDQMSASAVGKDVEESLISETGEIVPTFKSIWDDLKYYGGAAAVAAGAVAGRAELQVLSDEDRRSGVLSLVNNLATSLLSNAVGPIAKKVWVTVMEKVGTEEALKAIPFVGEALAAIGVVAGIARLAITADELSSAPRALHARISFIYDATITILPDDGSQGGPGSSVLPLGATSYKLSYQIEGTHPVGFQSGPLPAPPDGAGGLATFEIPVQAVPIGGAIHWEITLLDKNGNALAAGASPVVPNTANSPAKTVSIMVKNQAIDIDSTSTLDRKWTIAGTATGVEAKQGTGALPGLPSDLGVGDPSKLTELDGITVATRLGLVGYVWKAGGAWHARSMPLAGDPNKGWFHAGPFDRRPFLVYDSLTADAKGAHNFLLDPTGLRTGYHVRHVKQEPGLGIDPKSAHGYFPDDLADVCMHPAGMLVGVSKIGGLHLVQLSPDALPDSSAPGGVYASAGGTRPDATKAATLITATRDGNVVVLDVVDRSSVLLRAYGSEGNPTELFGGKTTLALDPKRLYVDLSSDGTNCLYLLSYSDESKATSWRVDVLNPDGTPVYTSNALNAGKLTVDFWRDVFTLGYQAVANPDLTPRIDPTSKVAEPATTLWITNTP